FDHTSGTADVVGLLTENKFTNHKRLKEFQRHHLWQTTLGNLKLWAGNNYRATRVVNALTKKVLAETTLLTLKHVTQRLQAAALACGGYSAPTASAVVVNQSVDRFL